MVSRVQQYVSFFTLLNIVAALGLAPDIPEDLYHLIKKAVNIRNHLQRSRQDKDAKFRLVLIESRIHRLSRYYCERKVLSANFKYDAKTAASLIA